MYNIMVVDDDAELYSMIAEFFAETEFRPDHAVDAEMAMERLQAGADAWDALILDVMLPGIGGMALLRQLRSKEQTRELPVLMLTALGGESDTISGLEAGADDYMAKPFSLKELSARLHALLRRSGKRPQEPDTDANYLRFDDLVIDRAALRLERDGMRIDLMPNELKLLEILLETPGKTVSRADLFRRVFGFAARHYDRSLDMTVSRLRKKIGPRPDGNERIRAIWGKGYMFLPSGRMP